MTKVSIDTADFLRLLGRDLSRAELEESLPMMGLAFEGWEGPAFEVDIFANHPDWYSAEGLARSFRGFLGAEPGLRRFEVGAPHHEFRLLPGVERVRPFAVGGFVRDLALDEALLKSLITLQERLHTTVGRKRAKVAIGIHDADTVTPPFTYRAVAPDSVRFVPLGAEVPMTPAEILVGHEKGKEYAPLLAGAEVVPLIEDAKGQVLSLPPIINGTVTQVTSHTRDLFLDVTGTGEESVTVVLHILMAALADRGGRLEAVHLVRGASRRTTPDLAAHPVTLDLDYAGRLLGIELTTKDAIDALTRMRYDVTAKGGSLTVLVPAYRADILHLVDIVEDIAVGYGYGRIPARLPQRATVGTTAPSERLAEAVRPLMNGYGFQEVVALPLTPREEPVSSQGRVAVRNPISEETAWVRGALLPGLLRLLEVNKHRDLPQRVFEVGAVASPTGNRLHLAGAAVSAKAGFTEAKSIVQGLLRDLGASADFVPVQDGNYLDGRCAAAAREGLEFGRFGEVHPRILDAHQLRHPVVAFEFDLSAL